MKLYRVGRAKYAHDITGEGARLFGGRWNHKLTGCLYTSESRALAVLEYTVNVNIDEIPRALCITTIEVPETSIIELHEKNLPGNWKEVPAPSSTKELGTKLLQEAKALIIKVPSTIIPNEYNFLINPRHPEIDTVRIEGVVDFVYDVRIKTV
jgi:RES domain-containing protein